MATATVSMEQTYSGPLPHPEALSGYQGIDPGLVERIVVMAEKEQSYRHGLHDRALDSANRRAWGGQISGLIVALGGLGVAAYCAHLGNAIAGSVIAAVDLCGLVSIFVWPRHNRNRDKSSTE